MHILVIGFTDSKDRVRLIYREKIGGDAAYVLLAPLIDATEDPPDELGHRIELTDDFGHRLACHPGDISLLFLTDTVAEGDSVVEQNVENMMVNDKFRQRVQTDPKLRFIAGAGAVRPAGGLMNQ